MKTLLLTPLFAAAAIGVSACGSDDKPAESVNSGARSALTEVDATRDGLKAARTSYLAGDKAKAGDQASEAYLQHFEHVEGPLETKDHELNEKLEDGIREELRDEIRSGTREEVEARFDMLFADLDKAEAALR